MVSELILFSTDHCTLCDEALDLLFSMPELIGRSVRVVDVAEDERLLEELSELIPVLDVHCESGAVRRLEWPFDRSMILKSLGGLH